MDETVIKYSKMVVDRLQKEMDELHRIIAGQRAKIKSLKKEIEDSKIYMERQNEDNNKLFLENHELKLQKDPKTLKEKNSILEDALNEQSEKIKCYEMDAIAMMNEFARMHRKIRAMELEKWRLESMVNRLSKEHDKN